MQPTGKCRLCGETCTLIDSHYLPKALFRLFAKASVDNPNPVVITDKSSVQTSRQVTAPLLCGQCEEIFSTRGESWVMKHIYRGNDEWKLRDILAPSIRLREGDRFPAASIPGANYDALTYFAASMFWRATAHKWSFGSEEVTGINLGPRYESEFRRYLLGRGGFPLNAALVVAVSNLNAPAMLAYPPHGKTAGRYHQYMFYIPGIRFHLFLGAAIPTRFREACIVRSPQHWIFCGDIDTIPLHLALDAVARTKRVGRLADGIAGSG